MTPSDLQSFAAQAADAALLVGLALAILIYVAVDATFGER